MVWPTSTERGIWSSANALLDECLRHEPSARSACKTLLPHLVSLRRLNLPPSHNVSGASSSELQAPANRLNHC
jgi:hypothetical protein